ncbi:hypothetical protein SD70_16315 [Gordoniibacillus kamchatkensis]|uniref:3-octaprenyl-4-hydroxybenzoate carboxy-lyase-like C-terminal domain-containing protein n=2 Tax=Gordoniibacillus kamchatkensis TaxID=1590651 RepID=A0ABR5AG91_9BACL|nr:hypothetical protein SD70_16315 [Paenibacillus sp. VKM B-2647]
MDQVDWCVATRFQADKDLVVVNYALGSKLDPSKEGGVGSKIGLDATVPLNAKPMEYVVTRIPDYERYIGEGKLLEQLPDNIVNRYLGTE